MCGVVGFHSVSITRLNISDNILMASHGGWEMMIIQIYSGDDVGE